MTKSVARASYPEFPPMFQGASLKLQRAEYHIDQLIQLQKALPNHLYFYGVEEVLATDGAKGFALRYFPLAPIPQFFAPIIGDAFHNLRCSLDHLATSIVRRTKPTAKIYFPITPNRDDLEVDRSLKQLEIALPSSKNLLLEVIRPPNYKTENLWAFAKLNNDDKHNLLAPTVAISNVAGVCAKTGGLTVKDHISGSDSMRTRNLVVSSDRIEFEGQPIVSTDVRFGNETPFSGQEAVVILMKVRKLVEDTLVEFNELAASHICASK